MLASGPLHSNNVSESSEVVAEGALPNLHSFHVPSLAPIPLKQREEIAKAAYKTWFRIKPGHKEIKDHWWALYYKKILPKYHLRDNHLGRKLNSWIEEDLQLFYQRNPGLHSKLDTPGLEEKTGTKRRKPNSSKEGTVPAYLNVELIRPPKLNPADFPPHLFKLMTCVVGNDIDWTPETLEDDIHWFKENRQKLMEAVPPVSLRSKRSGTPKKKTKIPEPISPLQDEVQDSNLEAQPYLICSAPWLRCDLLKSDEAYWLKVDLPGLAPGVDFFVQTDDIHKLVVKGERKADPEMQLDLPASSYLQQRPFGSFIIELILPLSVDLAKTEQTFHNGVLTVKCPTKENQWRNISDDINEL